MNSLHAFNRKARKLEEARVAETGDVEALQDKNKKHGRVYYPLGCTLSFNPGWKLTCPEAPLDSARRSNAICSTATWVVPGRLKFPITSATTPTGLPSVVLRPTTGAMSMLFIHRLRHS